MYDAKGTEKQILKFWQDKKIYEKVKQKNKKGKPFYFLQGPPYTSGKLHIGHAWNNCLKDAALRQKRMRGFNVWDRAGYDMHGLPTENAVQKLLKLKDKKAILKFGLNKFIKECRRFSTDRAREMDKDLLSFGVWLDFKNAYYPLDNDFMSNEWFLIKQAQEQNRLYKGKKIMHWCAHCETALAKHELEYELVKDKSIFLKFRVKNKKNEFIIIWTTTPWTIPFNLAVMVNPELDYIRAKVGEEVWIISKALSNAVITGLFNKQFQLLEEFKGSELEGLEYLHPLNELNTIYSELKKKHKNVHSIVLSQEYVTTDAGSGLVHCAPGCGPEDFEVGEKYGLPPFNTLDEKGTFHEMPGLNNMIAKKDDAKITTMLKNRGSLLEETEIEHEYPFCWRCHEPVIFRATEQWFLKIEDLIPFLLKENEKVHWIPKWAKEAYDSWTSSLRDNSITRQRFWGTPVPIWQCENKKCRNLEVIGSVQELKKKSKTKVPEDLHKPWIDSVKLRCKCGSSMTRVPDVLDVWLDSGTTGWNCLYYPKKTENWSLFPADFILEAHEHIRLWFSMLAICSAVAFKKSAFKSVFVHGMILDWEGRKMSKSLGNIISPYEVVDKVGVDIFRYYMTQLNPGENLSFNWEDLKIKQRNIQILWNLKNYLIELAKLNKYNPSKSKPVLGQEEKYMLSKTNSITKQVTDLFEKYNLDETVDYIESLYLELSRFYIQLIRDKIILGTPQQKKAIVWTIYNSLLSCLKLFAPICPFITEAIYQELRKEFKLKQESIHLYSWPKAEAEINKKIEQEFETAKLVIEKILAMRSEKGIGIRWPLAKAKVKINKKLKLGKPIMALIESHVNVKKLEIKGHDKKEISVELDTKMNEALETEGYVREVIRKVQDSRKKAKLVKENEILLELCLDKNLVGKIKKYKLGRLIEDKTNSKLNLLSTGELRKKRKYFFEVKIKDKKILIYFDIRK